MKARDAQIKLIIAIFLMAGSAGILGCGAVFADEDYANQASYQQDEFQRNLFAPGWTRPRVIGNSNDTYLALAQEDAGMKNFLEEQLYNNVAGKKPEGEGLELKGPRGDGGGKTTETEEVQKTTTEEVVEETLESSYVECDVNGDGQVTQKDWDLAYYLYSNNIRAGDPRFNPRADLNGDGQVTPGDKDVIAQRIGAPPVIITQTQTVFVSRSVPSETRTQTYGYSAPYPVFKTSKVFEYDYSGSKSSYDPTTLGLKSLSYNTTNGNNYPFLGLKDSIFNAGPEDDEKKSLIPFSSEDSSDFVKEAMGGEIRLEDVINYLEDKEDKTDLEKAVLEASKAVTKDKALMDEEAMKEFEETVRLVLMAESMRELLKDVDFEGITGAFKELAEEMEHMYNDYLASTDKIYKYLTGILGINVTEELLLKEGLSVREVAIRAKRKMLLDSMIELLQKKDKASLTENENKAVQIYSSAIKPLRDAYMSKLDDVFGKWRTAKNTLYKALEKVSTEREGAFILSNDAETRAIILLDRSGK